MQSEPPEHDLAWLTASLAADAAEGRGVLPDWLRPIAPGQQVVGAALVVMAPTDDNLAVRQVATGGMLPHPVLLIAGLERSRSACMGELVAQSLLQRGCRAVITDGLIRDVAALRRMALPIWRRGDTPRASRKEGPTWTGDMAVCGGVSVAHGDLIIADDDGVVVWPQAQIATLRRKAWEKLALDNARAARIAAGGTLDDPVAGNQ